MWIRGQSKANLIDVDEVHTNTNGNNLEVWTQKGTRQFQLGIYKTNERALEVVDMIQNQIVVGSSSDVIVNGKRIMQENVFQMPDK